MQLEIEQKYRLDDPSTLAARLAELGLVFGQPQRQIDTYFQHPARDFRQTDEAFRLRQIGDNNYLTYKGPKLDNTTKTRRELELAVAAGEAAGAQFIELFSALGFIAVGQVRKSRRSAALLWDQQNIEIAWDEIDDLGTYLELEIIADSAQLDAARAALQTLATRLELTTPERRGYLELLSASHPTT